MEERVGAQSFGEARINTITLENWHQNPSISVVKNLDLSHHKQMYLLPATDQIILQECYEAFDLHNEWGCLAVNDILP